VAEIYDAFQKHDCAGVGGRIIAQWNCKQPAWIDLDGPFRHTAFGGIVRFEKGEAPCQLSCTATGANMAFKRNVFERYGPFRTDLSGNHADRRRLGDMLGGEDTEYCQRLLNAGEKLMYAPRAKVFHPVEQYRVKKKYLQTFAFNYGRYITRIGGIPESAKSYFGFPRYLFPMALKYFLKWISSYGVKRRFFYRLQLSQMLGAMAEGKQQVKNRQRVPSVVPGSG
jgi:GT2 family glycosyltransferase